MWTEFDLCRVITGAIMTHSRTDESYGASHSGENTHIMDLFDQRALVLKQDAL